MKGGGAIAIWAMPKLTRHFSKWGLPLQAALPDKLQNIKDKNLSALPDELQNIKGKNLSALPDELQKIKDKIISAFADELLPGAALDGRHPHHRPHPLPRDW